MDELTSWPAVTGTSVDLATETATVALDPALADPLDDALDALRDLGVADVQVQHTAWPPACQQPAGNQTLEALPIGIATVTTRLSPVGRSREFPRRPRWRALRQTLHPLTSIWP